MWQSILNGITNITQAVNDVVWGWPVILLILGTGLLLSIRTGFLQVRKFGNSMNTTIIPTIRSIGRKPDRQAGSNTVSQFEAFATAISGTVGTGNIVGVTAAILTGGPGAVLWMWVSAFFGMVTNYAENVLGLFYRKKDKNGNFSGGAFYYIENGLKRKGFFGIVVRILAYMAAIVCLFAAVGMSGVQTNKISGALAGSLGPVFGISPDSEAETLVKLLIGIIVAILAAVIIIGGIQRIGRVASKLIPLMSLLFIVLALITIFGHASLIGPAFSLIFRSAFGLRQAAGGILGYTFAVVIKKGMSRGVFSNEAGLGSSVIAHSASETREPVKQGLWGIFEVFFDTFVICTLTALMFITSNYQLITNTPAEQLSELNDSTMSLSMFSDNFGTFGTVAFCIILPLFAFTTIMAWSYYGEKACEFCFQWVKNEKARRRFVLVFKILYVLFIVAAAVISSKLIWDMDDMFNGLMALPNLIALIQLSGQVARITKNYYQRQKGMKVEPMLSAYPDLNEEFRHDIEKNEKFR